MARGPTKPTVARVVPLSTVAAAHPPLYRCGGPAPTPGAPAHGSPADRSGGAFSAYRCGGPAPNPLPPRAVPPADCPRWHNLRLPLRWPRFHRCSRAWFLSTAAAGHSPPIAAVGPDPLPVPRAQFPLSTAPGGTTSAYRCGGLRPHPIRCSRAWSLPTAAAAHPLLTAAVA
ncbi:hypothetical protein GCM10010483_04100 [Actinokineospora diospyrosa]